VMMANTEDQVNKLIRSHQELCEECSILKCKHS
jgi:hypothetical protein